MSAKVHLQKAKVIVFMGSMNSMPMMYALELKKLGFEILYFVDAPIENALCRPEHHFPSISYPYPDWIIELALPTQMLLPLFPRIAAAWCEGKIRRKTKKEVGCFVLNGFFVSLAPFLAKSADKIGLSHGSDLDVWADRAGTGSLAVSFHDQSIFRYLPSVVSIRLIRWVVQRQYSGFARTKVVLYFPRGFHKRGDQIIDSLIAAGVHYVPRYDMSFEPVRDCSRTFKKPSPTLRILSAVRFKYMTFPDGGTEENKGNDIIIEGLAKYYARNPNIKIDFVEKGEDVGFAKVLCGKLGLTDVVMWHKEMPLRELLLLYVQADICFDQVGSHWIGAIGGYALYLGKPLIANPSAAVRAGVWPRDNPVCSATTADEIMDWLTKLEAVELRNAISDKSKAFAESNLTSRETLRTVFGVVS